MRFLEVLRLVWLNILENKSKVMLTSLGVIVGSATIVLVIAIGQGGQADVADQFKNLNAGAIDISTTTQQSAQMNQMGGMTGGGPPAGGMGGMGGGQMPSAALMQSMMRSAQAAGMFSGSRNSATSRNTRTASTVTLTTADVTDIGEFVPGLDTVTILVSGTTTVFGGSLEENKNSTVVGVLPNYEQVSNLELLYGSFLTEEDAENSAYVCVIGYSLAEEIFTYPYYAYGDYLSIDEKNYEIIGVLAEMGAVTSGISSDEAVYIPYSTASKYVFGTSAKPTMTAVAGDVAQVEAAIENIRTVLTENHPNGYFQITDAGSAMDAATQSANTLALLLFAVATIVFIVGGIGIMNVLFVSVKDRTPEIGILKAIGCSAGDILFEFLLEANFMGLVGGAFGVALGYALVPVIELFGMRLETTLWAGVLALFFAVFTATLFGLYPAYKASKLVPIEALQLN